jgi:hypothetical protein
MVQEFDFAGFQVVSPGNDLEVPGLYSFGQDWLSLLQLLGNIERLGADGVFDWIARADPSFALRPVRWRPARR